MSISDLWTLAPVAAACRGDVRARAESTGLGTVRMRAIVKGQERGRWYLCSDDTNVVADALEVAGRMDEAAEFRRAVANCRAA